MLPALFLLVLLAVQGAFYYHARTVAIAAAQEGARTAAALNATIAEGVAAAADFVADVGGDDVITGVSVDGSRGADTVTVTVAGNSASLIPGWSPTLTQSATAPVEKVTAW